MSNPSTGNKHMATLAYVLAVQPVADRVAQHLEIIPKTFQTKQNSAHGIYDYYPVINDESHDNLGMPGTKLKDFCNILKMLCHPICNWLYISGMDVSSESMV